MPGGFQHASNGEIQLGSVDFSGGKLGGGGGVGFGGERSDGERSDGERLADRSSMVIQKAPGSLALRW